MIASQLPLETKTYPHEQLFNSSVNKDVDGFSDTLHILSMTYPEMLCPTCRTSTTSVLETTVSVFSLSLPKVRVTCVVDDMFALVTMCQT